MTIALRDYREPDFAELLRIDRLCFPADLAYSGEELSAYIRHASALTLIAERDSVIAGFSVAWDSSPRLSSILKPAARSARLITIDVLEGVRRNRVGTLLLDAVEQEMAHRGCAIITLETAVDNTPAITFYQRRSYTVVRTLRHYYSNGVDALEMRKLLGRSGCT